MTEEQKAREKVLSKRNFMPKSAYLLGRENALTNEVNRLKVERLEEENMDLIFRVANEEARNKKLQIAVDKMSKALSEAAALMDSYDELLKKFVDLHEKMRGLCGGR